MGAITTVCGLIPHERAKLAGLSALAGLAGQCLRCHSGCWSGPESELLQGTPLAFMGGVSSPSWAVLHQGQTPRVTTILFQHHHQTPSPVFLTQWGVPRRPSSGLYLSRNFQGESIIVLKWPSTYLLIWELAQSPSGTDAQLVLRAAQKCPNCTHWNCLPLDQRSMQPLASGVLVSSGTTQDVSYP